MSLYIFLVEKLQHLSYFVTASGRWLDCCIDHAVRQTDVLNVHLGKWTAALVDW